MWRACFSVGLVSAVVFLSGCGGSDTTAAVGGGGTAGAPGGTAGSTGGIGGGGTGGGEACATGTTCAAPVPDDWTGPFVVHEDDAATGSPACPSAMPTVALDAFMELQPGDPAGCSCSCSAPTGAKCITVSGVNIQGSTLAACANPCGPSESFDSGQCTPAIQGTCGVNPGQPKVSMDLSLDLPNVAGATCSPVDSSTPAPAPEWAKVVRACSGDSLPACSGGGVCVSDGVEPFAKTCVEHSGDMACPAGPYTEKILAYGGVDDTRGCSACACGAPSGIKCEGTIDTFSQNGCGAGALVGTVPIPGCISWPPSPTGASPFYVRANVSPTGGACGVTGGQPTGTLSPAQPTTLCCIP